MPELATITWAKPNDVHSSASSNADPKHWTDSCSSSTSKMLGVGGAGGRGVLVVGGGAGGRVFEMELGVSQ